MILTFISGSAKYVTSQEKKCKSNEISCPSGDSGHHKKMYKRVLLVRMSIVTDSMEKNMEGS